MPRSGYTDVRLDTIKGQVLAKMRVYGITVNEFRAHFGRPNNYMHKIVEMLADMHGYDVRGVTAPQHRTANRDGGKGRRGCVYFVAGRHNWEHTEYESYVTPEGLIAKDTT